MATRPETIDDETEAGCSHGMDSDACATARRRDKEATKRALMTAAVEVFARRGYDGATTKEVAAAAGVNEGLIQRYFASEKVGGKAGLLQAIVGGICGEKLTACRLAPAGDCLEIEISKFLKHEIDQARINRNLMRVLLSRALLDPELAATLKAHYKESRVPLLVERLKHFRADGSLDPAIDLETLAGSVITLAFGLGFMQQVVLDEDPQQLCAIVDSLAKTMAQGATAREIGPGAA